MDIWDRIQNLAKLQYAISKGDQAAIEELKDLYWTALNRRMKRDCYSCRIRAYQELTNLTQERLNIMAHQKYTFKDPNSVIYFNHGHVTPANLTDDLAVEMVKASAKNAELFNGNFDDLEEKPKKKAEKKIEVPAETIVDAPKAD